MNRPSTWLWIGSAGALVLLGRKRSGSFGTPVLGLPVEVNGVPTVTPHGSFGAHRGGPPVHAHQGVDLAAPVGSHVFAVGDGVIVATDPGLGKIVRKLRLDLAGGWGLAPKRVHAVVYADLGKPLVKPGDRVRKGQPIALVDKSGFVHFAVKEVHSGGEAFFDPKRAGLVYRAQPGVA